jgi:hypothetical protein
VLVLHTSQEGARLEVARFDSRDPAIRVMSSLTSTFSRSPAAHDASVANRDTGAAESCASTMSRCTNVQDDPHEDSYQQQRRSSRGGCTLLNE